MAAQGAHRMVRFFEVATPVLTTEQRGKLVDHLSEHLSHIEASPNT